MRSCRRRTVPTDAPKRSPGGLAALVSLASGVRADRPRLARTRRGERRLQRRPFREPKGSPARAVPSSESATDHPRTLPDCRCRVARPSRRDPRLRSRRPRARVEEVRGAGRCRARGSERPPTQSSHPEREPRPRRSRRRTGQPHRRSVLRPESCSKPRRFLRRRERRTRPQRVWRDSLRRSGRSLRLRREPLRCRVRLPSRRWHRPRASPSVSSCSATNRPLRHGRHPLLPPHRRERSSHRTTGQRPNQSRSGPRGS